jgi:O-antigen/teichoic acid export membrane protein
MKAIVQRIHTNPHYIKAFEWVKIITLTGSAQVMVQAIGFISGILIIRLLSFQEYALYTLANTMLGTMTVLADVGISSGVTAQAGKVWQDREKLGIVLATGLDLRNKFAIGSMLITTPVLLFLLQHRGANFLISVLILGSIIPAFYSTLSGTLLQIAPKLRQDIAPLQKNQVIVNMVRLALLSITLFVFPWAFVAILAAGLPQIWANKNLRKISLGYADWRQKVDLGVQKEILAVVKRMLPGTIYYCVSGQITVWLISIFGSTTAVAQIGALSRLAMILSLFSLIFNILIVPRFARMPNDRSLLLKRYLILQSFLIFISVIIIVIVWLFPFQLLWVLGKQYSGLNNELLLQIAGSCLNMIVGINFSLNANRGWIMNPVFNIIIGLLGIICGLLVADISTSRGILIFNLFPAVVVASTYTGYGLLRIIKG